MAARIVEVIDMSTRIATLALLVAAATFVGIVVFLGIVTFTGRIEG